MPTKPLSFATTSAFEILGPIMVGPSSSHTAGALRCARVAATLLEGEPTHVTFTLWNSFAHTYRGHGTDRALVAGVLGLDTDDERIRDAFSLAEERGLDYKFVIGGDDPSIHPNTVDIALERWRTTAWRAPHRPFARPGDLRDLHRAARLGHYPRSRDFRTRSIR